MRRQMEDLFITVVIGFLLVAGVYVTWIAVSIVLLATDRIQP